MSQTSPLTRYRPAVLAITGVAAGYGIYLLYTSFRDRPTKSALHRSNATRRARSWPRIRTTMPKLGSPLGTITVTSGDGSERTLTIKVGVDKIPPGEVFRQTLGLSQDENPRAGVEEVALDLVILVCFNPERYGSREGIEVLGLTGLPEALRSGDIELADTYKPTLADLFGDVSPIRMDGAFRRAFENPPSELGHTLLNDDATYGAGSGTATLEVAETEESLITNGADREPSQGLKGLLYYVAEGNAKRKAYEHRGVMCEECGESPIRDVRWHCLNCPDFDLCSTCEPSTFHPKTHVFAKIKIPLPALSQPSKEHPLWYPGDPRKLHGSLRSETKKRLSAETGFEEPQMDALYDQFTCLANMPWPADTDHVHAAIDRRAFDKALTSDRWENRFAPNALHDRMFAFYDANGDGLLGFDEFIHGLAYLRGPKRFEPLHRALQGYDMDADGYIDRFDILRLLRAKYTVQKQIISDMIEGREPEQTLSAMETLRSSQPISSVFSQEDTPQGEGRPRHGKVMNALGDMQLATDTKAILNDEDPWIAENDEKFDGPEWEAGSSVAAGRVVQQHLSRFEEMLYGESDPALTNTGAPPRATDGGPRNDSVDVLSLQPSLTDAERRSLGLLQCSYYSSDEPLNHEILWQVVEEGFQQMLDPLFGEKEHLHAEVRSTKKERTKWRGELDRLAEERTTFQQELQDAAETDPLMATASESQATVTANLRKEQKQAPPLKEQIASADSVSLERLECEIARKPLEELLSATGYGTVEDAEAAERSDRSPNTKSSPPSQGQPAFDPTMPQNRPDTVPPVSAPPSAPLENGRAKSPEKVPSRARLEHLLDLDGEEREIARRGGAGRLSFDEVEGIVNADSTRDLRGLVTSWLEWASF